MKVTESGKPKYRQLQKEGYPPKVSAEQREYAEECAPPKMTETDITNTNREKLIQSLRDGKYRSKPVRRVEIPKENGKTRKLGIPTVVDRLIQQAICQVLTPIFEKQFSDNSFGFRPKRSAKRS